MLLPEPALAKSFWVNSGAFTLNNSSIMVNSSSSSAAVVDGMGGSRPNASLRTVGGTSGSFSPAAQASNGTSPSNFGPLANPYALVPVPSTAGLTTYSQSSYSPDGSGNITLNPGYYPNGLYCISGGNVTMNPGLYYIANGNFWINTPGTVNATGVTVYHDGPNSSACSTSGSTSTAASSCA